MAQTNLPTDLARAAVRAHNQEINDIAWFGDDEHGLDGFQDFSDIPEAAAPTGAWASATAEQMVDDVGAALLQVIETSKGVHQPNRVILPPDKLARAATKRLPNVNTTALGFLRENWPGVQFIGATELTDWRGETTDALIAGQFDPQNIELEVPMPYTEYPVQEKGLEFEIPTESRVGGLVVRYPKAFSIKTGI